MIVAETSTGTCKKYAVVNFQIFDDEGTKLANPYPALLAHVDCIVLYLPSVYDGPALRDFFAIKHVISIPS